MKKTLAAILVFLLTLTLAVSVAFAAPAPMGMDDYWIKVGGTDINLLTYDVASILSASGKKITTHKYWLENERMTGYCIKAKEATFYLSDDVDFCQSVSLTKKGATARGIKIGSTLSKLLEAYPVTDEPWSDSKTTYYSVKVAGPEFLTSSDVDNLDKMRPIYFYETIFQVNNKTKKITAITIAPAYFD